ncbi:hypothetical protein QRX50_13665 [Amycolatopsis carbonis]|uniref:Uncharacterized protein n=1 Tax=Amycolatopsis carbonis TaxID=715471 RepID=A0A9Y2IKE6_9PSEU|nr:hypothetical protein [Amycolatopsis sp. 2-15]WIX81727.1 hypothetical protein QRX50_13665 [Amycolatopsis sp. 2-15]
MDYYPSTPEEEEKLHRALTSGAQYQLEVKTTIIVLDEDELVRQAREKIESARFENDSSRAHMLEVVGSDPAEAIGALLSIYNIIDTNAAICRSSSHKIRLMP